MRALTFHSWPQFPYSIRLESTITESNGSSSMATVCAGCLALQDAGVPLKQPIAGVAMGLVLPEAAGQEAIVLTDILGRFALGGCVPVAPVAHADATGRAQ